MGQQISGAILHRKNEQTKKSEFTFELNIVEDDMKTVVDGPFVSPLVFKSEQEAKFAMDKKVREILAQAGLKITKTATLTLDGELISVQNESQEYDA